MAPPQASDIADKLDHLKNVQAIDPARQKAARPRRIPPAILFLAGGLTGGAGVALAFLLAVPGLPRVTPGAATDDAAATPAPLAGGSRTDTATDAPPRANAAAPDGALRPAAPATTGAGSSAPPLATASMPAPTIQAAGFSASGFVVARRKATVSAQITGQIVRIEVEEGERVAAGDVIARLDAQAADAEVARMTAELAAARADRAAADSQIDEAERALARTQALIERAFATEALLIERRTRLARLRAESRQADARVQATKAGLATARVRRDQHIIRAPFAGVVVEKNAQPGEIISPVSAGGGFTRTGICTLIDMASLELEVDVNESFIARVRPGQRVRAELNAYPDTPIAGRVVAKLATADRNKATVRTRIAILDQNENILPEMAVTVFFPATRDDTPG
ncbi:RND family efflux transporter MFP subunit [Rhodothalassium salexigens DSM 2132]|uniref:RND family efflux transporter MFP subunit n=2 Tax=Rhodothalassium salexigens TaxID=1086 RepID=A0A4R2P814_RHOSA|nr:hypothetical protein [Rhodothalassium salexigens DSM 2132]TCP31109.1 RND family efflux transporter MFP subunit [Rhodothalassium salexigens DSM 2132]